MTQLSILSDTAAYNTISANIYSKKELQIKNSFRDKIKITYTGTQFVYAVLISRLIQQIMVYLIRIT